VSESQSPGFLDAVATAFLRRRLHSRRLRVAALHGLTTVSNGAGDGLQMDFDHAASSFAHATPWMAAHTEGLATAPAPPAEPPRVPPLSIVIMAIGSRGDIQPFIPIGRRLAERHRVRIATHREFRPMVERADLEFYPLGGDPHEMMEYIVKTRGSIVPTRLGQLWEDVPKKRAMIAEILASTWRACTEPDPDGPEALPFRADLIVANPPSYGHIHCAEALHIPLHMIFTMPWTATTAFPHPFARIDPGTYRPIENFFSYGIVDLLVWAGIGDLVDDFRTKTLNLSPITLADGASLLDDYEVPFTYLWPASLVPKPKEWGPTSIWRTSSSTSKLTHTSRRSRCSTSWRRARHRSTSGSARWWPKTPPRSHAPSSPRSTRRTRAASYPRGGRTWETWRRHRTST
jgi:hypothetical protein